MVDGDWHEVDKASEADRAKYRFYKVVVELPWRRAWGARPTSGAIPFDGMAALHDGALGITRPTMRAHRNRAMVG